MCPRPCHYYYVLSPRLSPSLYLPRPKGRRQFTARIVNVLRVSAVLSSRPLYCAPLRLIVIAGWRFIIALRPSAFDLRMYRKNQQTRDVCFTRFLFRFPLFDFNHDSIYSWSIFVFNHPTPSSSVTVYFAINIINIGLKWNVYHASITEDRRLS